MTTYNISTGAGWQNLPNVLNSGDVVNFTSNFTFTTTNIATKKEFPTGSTLNGNFFTITLPSGLVNDNAMNGFIRLTGGIIKNINVDANGNHAGKTGSGAFYGSFIIESIIISEPNRELWGNIENINISNGTVMRGGVLCGRYFGMNMPPYTTNTRSYIRRCRSSCTIGGILSGGLIARDLLNTTVEDCYFDGAFTVGSTSIGGIIGDETKDCIIKNCYNLTNINQNGIGGIIAAFSAIFTNSYPNYIAFNRIYNCYNLGNINNNQVGGILGSCAGSNVEMDISNCYNLGEFGGAATNSGGIVRRISPSTSVAPKFVNITNCYSLNNISSNELPSGCAFIVSDIAINNSNYSVNINNVCVNDITGITNTVSANAVVNINNPISPLTQIQGQPLPESWSKTAWIPPANPTDYPALRSFSNLNIWTGFENYLSSPTLVTTFVKYKFPIVIKLGSMFSQSPIIEENIPENPTSFSLSQFSPPLPDGLSLNTSTGVISGVPNSILNNQIYEINVTYPQLQNQNIFLSLGVAILNYPSSNYNLFIDRNVSIEPNIDGGSDALFYTITDNPPLPSGLNLNTNNGIISGSPQELQNKEFYTINAFFSLPDNNDLELLSEEMSVDTEISIKTSIFICLTGDVLIHTNKGIIKLEDICKNHKKYLIKTGEKQPRYSRIYKIFKEKYTGDIYKYKNVSMTPEHCFKLKIEDEWVQAQNSPLTTKVNTETIIYHLSLEKTDDTFLIQASDNETIISDSWNHNEMEAMKEKFLN